MYDIVLIIHNIFRWVVLLFGVTALAAAFWGLLGRRVWTPLSRLLGVFFAASLDVQVLIGLILYIFLSPLTSAAFQNFGAAMADAAVRFFTLEHIFYMLVAVALVHIGNVLIRRAKSDTVKYRRATIWYSLTLLIILVAIPWWRLLFRV